MPHLPACRRVGLRERTDHDGARGNLRMAREALVPGAIEQDVLVDFVGDHDGIGVLKHTRQFADIVGRPDHAGEPIQPADRGSTGCDDRAS